MSEWRAGKHWITLQHDHRVRYVSRGSGVVAQVWLVSGDQGLTMQEREAETISNANVIAAAREVLAALKSLRDYCHNTIPYFADPVNGDREANELDRICDAAIAKAEKP